MQNIVLSLPAQIPDHARERTRSQPVTEASAKPRFPVIESLTRSSIASELPLRGLYIPQVLHARHSVVAVNQALIRLGAEPSDLVLLYKDYAYPERDHVLRELAEMGIQIAPLAEIKPELARLRERLMATDGRFLALDDGGYIACAVAADPALMTHAVGFIEQTTRGVNAVRHRYHDLGQPMQKPHLSLPCSEIKRTFECGPVGKVFMEALAWHAGGQLAGRSVAVIGASGVIGGSIAMTAVEAGMHVRAYDIAPKGRYWTLTNFGRMQVCATKAETIFDSDFVIGATGNNVLQPLDLKQCKNGVLLASASSGQYEFPLSLLNQLAVAVTPYQVSQERPQHGLTYRMPWGKTITVLDGGRPLNLGIAAGPEAPCFDLIMSLLVAGAAELAAGHYDGETGFINRFDDICSRYYLDDLYMLLHGEDAR